MNFRWAQINGDSLEYAIAEGRNGDEFIFENGRGVCLRREPGMTNAERRAYEECAKIAIKVGDSINELAEGAFVGHSIAEAIRAAIPPREEEKPADAING